MTGTLSLTDRQERLWKKTEKTPEILAACPAGGGVSDRGGGRLRLLRIQRIHLLNHPSACYCGARGGRVPLPGDIDWNAF